MEAAYLSFNNTLLIKDFGYSVIGRKVYTTKGISHSK
jgi:hypothetical protein